MPQIQFIESGWIFLLFSETGAHSANCAVLRRNYSDAALGLVLDMPVIVQRQVPLRLSRSSTSLSWRRGSLLGPVLITTEILQLQ